MRDFDRPLPRSEPRLLLLLPREDLDDLDDEDDDDDELLEDVTLDESDAFPDDEELERAL